MPDRYPDPDDAPATRGELRHEILEVRREMARADVMEEKFNVVNQKFEVVNEKFKSVHEKIDQTATTLRAEIQSAMEKAISKMTWRMVGMALVIIGSNYFIR